MTADRSGEPFPLHLRCGCGTGFDASRLEGPHPCPGCGTPYDLKGMSRAVWEELKRHAAPGYEDPWERPYEYVFSKDRQREEAENKPVKTGWQKPKDRNKKGRR